MLQVTELQKLDAGVREQITLSIQLSVDDVTGDRATEAGCRCS